jgi:hypothetical protein
MAWRRFNAFGGAFSAVLWVVATYTGWVNTIWFISHVTMATAVCTFVAAWRADVPVDDDD